MKAITIKYLEGRATKIEQQKLLEWLRNKENLLLFQNYRSEWSANLKKKELSSTSEDMWNRIQSQILERGSRKGSRTNNMNRFLKIAAVVLLSINIGSLAIIFSSPTQAPENFTTVIAENGHISKVELPDGSMIWLNSGSKITYNNYFASDNRNIKLVGEAFFEVTKNKDLPLIVNSGELQIKVLGTKFNVSAYPKCNQVDVVLVRGSVELLNSKVESFSYKLKPGKLATFDKISRKLVVKRVNTNRYTSWKKGVTNIHNKSLEDLVQQLQVYYNQKFEFSDAVKDFHFTFTIKNDSLDDIIKLMEKISPIKAKYIDDNIRFELDTIKMNKMNKTKDDK